MSFERHDGPNRCTNCNGWGFVYSSGPCNRGAWQCNDLADRDDIVVSVIPPGGLYIACRQVCPRCDGFGYVRDDDKRPPCVVDLIHDPTQPQDETIILINEDEG